MRNRLIPAIAFVAFITLGVVRANAVSLSLSDSVSGLASRSATTNSTFTLVLKLTADQSVTGLDYNLSDANFNVGDVPLRITKRDLTGSTFPFATTSSDSDVSSSLNNDNALDKVNNKLLGASVQNLNSPATASATPYLVAMYDITIPLGAAPGSHPLSITNQTAGTTFNPTYDWLDSGSSSHAFSNNATFALTVVPEPTSLGLLGLGALGLLARRRRSA